MKKLILILSLLAAAPAIAAPKFECRAVNKGESGYETQLQFDNQAAFVGDSYLPKLNTSVSLKKSVHKFKSPAGDVRMTVVVQERNDTSKIVEHKGAKVRSFKANITANINGEKWNFNGNCVEQLNK